MIGLSAIVLGFYTTRELGNVSAYDEASEHDLDKTLLRLTAGFFAFYTHMTAQALRHGINEKSDHPCWLQWFNDIIELAQVILQVTFLEQLREKVS